MAEASEAPMTPELARAQAMLSELDAGDAEVSRSEPVAREVTPDQPDVGQPGEAEASSESNEAPEAPPTPEEGDDPDESSGGLDLEWIDTQDSAYADFLSNLHQEGKLDPDTFEAVKKAYQPRKGMNAAQKRAAEFKADAEKWRDTGLPLFEDDQAREDFLAWRESRSSGEPKTAENPMGDLKERLKAALEEGDDDDLVSTFLDVAEKIADTKITSTRSEEDRELQMVQQYNASLNEWSRSVEKHFMEIEDASKQDVLAAAEAYEASLTRRGQNAMDVIRSEDDLREELTPFVEREVNKRRLKEVLGSKAERSKRYNGDTLKASSSPAVDSKAEEDLTTPEGRLRALKGDREIQSLLEQLGGTL